VSVRLEVLPPGEWGETVGARLAGRIAARPGIRLCLPTGNTPVPAYAAFAAGGGRLADAEVFLLDEFDLPAGHPARCDQMLQRDLLDRLGEAPGRLHRFDTAAGSLDDECARYAGLVESGGLDLTLLGLGANGHLGLNEPGSTADDPCRVVALEPETVAHAAGYGGDTVPERGLTLGLREILASREIWLLVTGPHKAGILQRTLHGPVGPEVPASFLRGHPDVTVLVDEDAAPRPD